MPTIQDAARQAGVGISTYVKSETRERVLRGIEDLRDVPNEMARSLSAGEMIRIHIQKGCIQNCSF